MSTHWSTAALLSLLIAAGCSDRGKENPPNFEQEAVAPTTSAPTADHAPAPEASYENDRTLSPRADSSARPATPRARAMAGDRATSSRSTASTTKAPRAEVSAPTSQDWNRRRADTLSASKSATAPAPEWREVTIPEGTALPLELQTALSSETAKVEAPVRARVRQAVVVNGYTAIPAGAIMTGTVTDVERAGRVQGRARLAFTFTEVETHDGREDLKTNPITYVAEQTKGEDATKIGGGAVGGAIIGGILGGGKGAAKGAVIGGAAGTGVVLATRGKEVNLASGTDIAASLAEPLKIRVPNR